MSKTRHSLQHMPRFGAHPLRLRPCLKAHSAHAEVMHILCPSACILCQAKPGQCSCLGAQQLPIVKHNANVLLLLLDTMFWDAAGSNKKKGLQHAARAMCMQPA